MQDIPINIENLAGNGELGEDLEACKVHDEAHVTLPRNNRNPACAEAPKIEDYFFQDHTLVLKIQNRLAKLENTVSRYRGHDFKAYYKALPKHIVTIRSRLKWTSVHYGIGKKKWMEMMKSRDALEKNLETSALKNDEFIKMSMERNVFNIKLEQLRDKLRVLETSLKDGNSALYCAMDCYENIEAVSEQFRCNVVEFQKSVQIFRTNLEERYCTKNINNKIA